MDKDVEGKTTLIGISSSNIIRKILIVKGITIYQNMMQKLTYLEALSL